MHFDDRLATVLRLPPSGDGLARIQFRQLVDILGRAPNPREPSETVEAGFTRLQELGRQIPTADRARLLRAPLQAMTNPRLLAWLAEAEPDVACAAIRAARLDDEDWLALIPALPVRARGILRHRRDLPPRVETLLERLGVRDRALPPGPCEDQTANVAAAPDMVLGADLKFEPDPEASLPEEPRASFNAPTGNIAVDQDMSADVLELLGMDAQPPAPTSLSEWAKARAAQQHKDVQLKAANADHSRDSRSGGANSGEAGIGAIVRRIEEFRRARAMQGAVGTSADANAPRLPLGDTAPATVRLALAIDFTTDVHGRIAWADGPYASSVIGLSLPAAQDGAGNSHDLGTAMRQRLPLRAARIAVAGAPAVSGAWQVDAIARFEGGGFIGYCGRLRRPTPPVAAPATPCADTAEADRMREVLHELRTPANAIQVAAEIIQQQLYGPAPHEYRALAAAIAGDCAHILAGFEELDRLVKLETGALPLDEGECDLARVLAQTVARLRTWTEPRGSSFALTSDPSAATLPVRVARAEVERLIWRLFAALASSTAPGEALELTWAMRAGMVEVAVALPSVLAERDPDTLFDAVAGERGQSLATGMFGIGFTLRLAMAEAAAAGGMLQRVNNALHLSLPALTAVNAGNSTSATISP
ncbi:MULTISPECIES: sensor histidine kinase [unclassified Novosphingobium]|uniref:sensor histidine kinase n=1 Tax=unclassified Novosphingobium TaxID=2644732 RepID=UPI00135A67E3|nr:MULTISPECIES: sensor histidine kinase [unclassified Novosphingobium]